MQDGNRKVETPFCTVRPSVKQPPITSAFFNQKYTPFSLQANYGLSLLSQYYDYVHAE